MSADITEERIAELAAIVNDIQSEREGELLPYSVGHELLTSLLSARSQLAALQSVPQGVEVPELDPGANPHQRNIENPGSFGWTLNRAFRDGYNEARKNARLVPTPPQAAPGAVIKPIQPQLRVEVDGEEIIELLEGFIRTNERVGISAMARVGHAKDVVKEIRARLATPQLLQPEERRVGPDEVVVPRSAAEYAIRAFDWIECPDSEHYEAWRAFLDALRTSAQDHNGSALAAGGEG